MRSVHHSRKNELPVKSGYTLEPMLSVLDFVSQLLAIYEISRQNDSLVPRRSKNRRERLVHTVRACMKSPW